MTRYVVDASVAVKWLVREPLSHQASLLLAEGVSLLAPDLLFAEAANALWAMSARGDLEDQEFHEAVQTLRMAPVLVPSTLLQLTPAASRLAADLGHPIYDCFYLALAIQEKAPLITADLRFCERVESHPYLSDSVVRLGELG